MRSDTTPRVLIVQRDFAYGDLLSAWFRAAGFDVIQCSGPHPSDYRCPILESGTDGGQNGDAANHRACPLVEAADALIYDPWLYISPQSPNALPLIRSLRTRYPDQPLILTWEMEGMSDLGMGLSKEEHVYVGSSEPAEVVGLVRHLLGMAERGIAV